MNILQYHKTPRSDAIPLGAFIYQNELYDLYILNINPIAETASFGAHYGKHPSEYLNGEIHKHTVYGGVVIKEENKRAMMLSLIPWII
jgi:hypothetical protein